MTTILKPSEVIYALDGDEYDSYSQRWKVAAPPKVMAALEALQADFDGAYCQMDNCPKEGGAIVGWSLHDDDTGRSMYQRWNYTALVDTGEKVYRCCEDCHCALLPKTEQPEGYAALSREDAEYDTRIEPNPGAQS